MREMLVIGLSIFILAAVIIAYARHVLKKSAESPGCGCGSDKGSCGGCASLREKS